MKTALGPGLMGRQKWFGIRRAYNSRAITIPFHPCRVLWGHGRFWRAHSKCWQRSLMFLKLGRTLAKEGKDASNIVTSSMVMMVSIFIVDCHVKHDIGRSVLVSFRVCTQRGANRCTIGINRTVDSVETAIISINGNGVPCG